MPNGKYDRFVPSGVDAQSWLGFEQRVQERRFRALLQTMNQAIAAGDAIEARVALEEARELRPAAPELDEIEAQLALIPVLPPPESADAVVRSRALGAVLLLLIGISLLLGIEWARSTETVEPPLPVATAPDLQMARPAVTPATEPPVTIVPPPPAGEIALPEPVATTGLERAIRRQPVPVRREPTFRPASTVRPVPTGEIPDDYVFRPAAARPRPTSRTPIRGNRPDTSAPAAGNRPAVTIAPTSTAAVPVILRRVDETRVAAVLDRYARAYGQLDAGAAREVWPTVNEPALARAFAGLASQDVAFDDCQIDVRGAVANASCRGTASYVGKIGNGTPQTEARTWRFELRRDGEAWTIENAEARRQ